MNSVEPSLDFTPFGDCPSHSDFDLSRTASSDGFAEFPMEEA